MPYSGIAGSCGSFIPSFFKGISLLFSIVVVSFCIPTNSVRVPFSPHPLQHFFFCRFFDDGHSDWHEVRISKYFIVVLICISAIMTDVEHLFMFLLTVCISSL